MFDQDIETIYTTVELKFKIRILKYFISAPMTCFWSVIFPQVNLLICTKDIACGIFILNIAFCIKLTLSHF